MYLNVLRYCVMTLSVFSRFDAIALTSLVQNPLISSGSISTNVRGFKTIVLFMIPDGKQEKKKKKVCKKNLFFIFYIYFTSFLYKNLDDCFVDT